MHGSASTRASAAACEPLACILAVKNVFCFSTTPIKFIFAGDGKTNTPRFTAVAAYQRALEVLHKQRHEDGSEDKRHKSLMLSYPSHLLFQVEPLKQHESIFLQKERLKYDTGLCNDHQGQNETPDRSLGCR